MTTFPNRGFYRGEFGKLRKETKATASSFLDIPGGYTYLASPYSSLDEGIRLSRYILAQARVATHLASGSPIFSPIVHWHPLAVSLNRPYSWEFWKTQNDALLASAGAIEVLAIPGWVESAGIAYELGVARKLDLELTIHYEGETILCDHKSWDPKVVQTEAFLREAFAQE